MNRSHRLHARYTHRASIAFRVGTAIIAGRTVNLSRGGLCAELDEPIPPGIDAAVDLRLELEDGGCSEPLRLQGQIVWCTPIDDRYQVGFAFRRLDAETLVYLLMFLRYLDPGKARPRAERPATVDERFCY